MFLLSVIVWRWAYTLNRRPPYKKSQALIAYEKAMGIESDETGDSKTSKGKKLKQGESAKGGKENNNQMGSAETRRLKSL